MAAGKLVKAVVATGRTIELDKQAYGPGSEISLPESEVATLRASGHLVDPSVQPPPPAEGPTFLSADGASVTALS